MSATPAEPWADQSRQEAVYGAGAMSRLRDSRVLISGLNGLGVEIAKNVILANVGFLALHDSKNVEPADCGSNFFVKPSDAGKNRAEVSSVQVQELNPGCTVSALAGETVATITEALNKDAYTIVVLIDSTQEAALAINELCREKKVAFIRADCRGVFGSVFVDNGDSFVVNDTTGENPKSCIVKDISTANPGVVKMIFGDDGRHDMETGDVVKFTEVQGMELNGTEHKITVINPYAFSIGDTSELGTYKTGGIATQVKQPKTVQFKSLKERLADPGELIVADWGKWGRAELLFIAFQALDAFMGKHGGALPAPCSAADKQELIELAKEVNGKVAEGSRVEIDEAAEAVLGKLAHTARACINPMAALFGGLTGQEVVKACTGKYSPIEQWFFLDAIEALPPKDLPDGEYALEGTRYDHNIICFGKSFQEKVKNLNYFLVGAGALGCEFLKNFALLGVGCSEGGKVTVTDDDKIESSNLSRQFLFRVQHIGDNKSTTAANSAKEMNPDFNVVALTERVGSNTENIFDAKFWGDLSGVCNALDNIKARLYVDSRCVFFGKTLLESGTLGTKGNVQVVVPHKSEHYGASADPPEKEAPMCTMHLFPHNIDHTLIWAQSEFVGAFDTSAVNAVKYKAEGPAFVANLRKQKMSDAEIKEALVGVSNTGEDGGIIEVLTTGACSTFADCVEWARNRFEQLVCNKIKQLIFMFPEDAKTSKGTPFWTPPKRFPTALQFDPEDDMHMQFVIAAANLRAKMFGIERPAEPTNRDPATFKPLLAKAKVPEFVPKKLDVQTQDADGGEDDEEVKINAGEVSIDDLVARLPAPDSLKTVTICPDEFEKDDDMNFHIDFVQALGNLRARNYGIGEVNALTARLKAGRIIPAIATTTAMVTGFVGLELCKLIHDVEGEAYRNTFVNLALPVFALSEVVPPQKVVSRTVKTVPDPVNHPDYVEEAEVKAYPDPHTAWDKIWVDEGDLTVQGLADHFASTTELTLVSLCDTAGALLYTNYMPKHKERLDKTITSLITEMSTQELSDERGFVEIVCQFELGSAETVDTPPIYLRYKK